MNKTVVTVTNGFTYISYELNLLLID